MTYPQVLTRSVVETDDGTNLSCNLQRNIGSEKAAKQINQKKVGTRQSEIFAQQKKPINRRMKTSTEFDLPEQSHRGEDPVKIRRMAKLNTQKIEYGSNHKD